jgi:lipid II:glycine glycyltransferase (peptidoglycan interpeptide bridge formation enzyme)
MDTSSENYRIEIDQINKAQWENLIQLFDDANIYQTWSYGAIRWGQENLSHIVIKHKDEIIAAAQLRIVKIPLLKAGIAYLPWGPMWRRKGQQINIDVFQKIISALKEEYAVKQRLLLRIYPNVIEEHGKTIVSILNKAGFQKKVKIKPYRTLMLNLSPTMPEIRKSLDQKWRNQLNRAEKNNLKIIEGNSDELYQIFLDLQGEMHGRKKYVPGVDYNEFRDIQKDLPEQLKMIVLICEYEGKALTTTIGSLIGDTGIYLLGAMGNEGMKMKGAYLLQWRLIEKMKESGYKWYDLGGIDSDENPGVYHFKSGIARKEALHIGQFEISQSGFSRLIVESMEGLKNIWLNLNKYWRNKNKKRISGRLNGTDPRTSV